MLLFLISCLSLMLLSKSVFELQSLSVMHSRMWAFPRILFITLKGLHKILDRKRKFFKGIFYVPSSRKENGGVSLLDLPDSVLDCILDKLAPTDLCLLSVVCSSFKEKCINNYLWEKHFNQKWGGVFGGAAWKQWRNFISSKRSPNPQLNCRSQFLPVLSFLGLKWSHEKRKNSNSMGNSSFLSLFAALETGNFWFPAQVHDREVKNGYVGFALSCYDALLCYDSSTDSFIARYPCQGRSMIEDNVKWDRIRIPPVDTPSNVLHISHYLVQLKPDDHIEIQWRRNTQFPYGWWYGIVGHLDTCSGNTFTCQCHISDMVVLEFRQYEFGSRWRRTMISKKDHREVGSKGDGFYGGIRKIHSKQEIAKWQRFWPNCTTLR